MEAILEELTIQQVLLESMQAESWSGIELEKQEIADNIERLKLQLRQIKQGHLPTRDNDIASPHADYPSRPGPSFERSNPEPRTPSTRGHSFKMETPRGDEDARGNPLTVRSRKREFHEMDSHPTDDRMKSRRTTPTHGVGCVSGSSGHDGRPSPNESIDVIDLTGDDADIDAWCVSQQLLQDKRRKQEAEDRQVAMQLSSQQTTTPSSSILPSSSNTESSQRSAFEQFKIAMPGTSMRSFHAPGVHISGGNSLGARGHSQNPGSGAQPLNSQSILPSNSPNPMSASSSQQAMDNGSRYSRHPSFAGFSGSSMSRVIDKTSMVDFTNGIDVWGNPLNSRLVNLFHPSDESPATDKELDDLLKNIRPDIDIPEHNREVGSEGLKYPLYRHQGVALAWMKKMEEGTNKGGILADDMGLGKTISTLALMLSNPATSRPKTNLIIGPLSLIRQWEEEIAKKTKVGHKLSVFVYHGKKTTTEELLKFDVVLTTYGTIAQELKRLDQFIEDNKDRNIDFKNRSCAVKFPLLNPGMAVFHRVILDEAQCIKNRNTRTAKACHHLKSTYRWCLTGTPMMNGILELYSLVKFLQIKPYNSWEHFRQAFGVLFGQKGDPKSQAMDRLRALLKAVMLRRKKDSKLDGKPILVLPPKTEHIVYATLSSDERDFYKQLEEKAQVMFSKYLREGSIGKNYSNILVLLLRLRQACCHPHLNMDVDDATSVVVGSDDNVEQLVKDLDKTIVQRVRALENFECPICYDVVQSPCFFVPCGHDSCKDCLIRITDNAISQNLHEGHESDKAKCPVCRGTFDPRKCFTYDLFKKIHMPENVVKAEPVGTNLSDANNESDSEDSEDEEEEEEEEEEESGDDVDEKGNLKGFIVDDDDVEDDAVDDDDDDDNLINPEALTREALSLEQKERKKKQNKRKKNKNKGKGKEKKTDVKPSMLKSLRLEAAKNRVAYKKYMKYLRKTWMPAAKVTECMKLLTKIGETGEKTIVFSQWTLLLDLLEVAMWHEKFKHKPVRYDGSMTGDQRSGAAQTFRDDPKVRVMLVSLRAGNAGLNLTVASRVIIMDPFWNPYIEMQAIDRTYRIGQQREVQVYRILTTETVEDRIVQLQDKKKEIVEAALDETESMKIGRLNVNELKFLFNTN
ncbi:hypothetical protein C2857_000921 [Epichloe festucae Fl1]|uniref:SWI/SNF family DNA-dependent ATPase Ris1 n=1 Tax=Epichloe festucae (strain Fl1) TaxID=877507 RepID=A0A7S9KUG3_EPIFF|nr:hypothetical protein C2857_000921 [Epichloe festucae Fl1]